jgi:hypothetical protein
VLPVNLIDKQDRIAASVDHTLGEKNAVVVASRPLKEFEIKLRFFSNDLYGTDMTQDFSFTGVPEKIHNGTDTAEWTASAIDGVWDFASTDQANTGTKSVDATLTNNNDIAQFAKGSDIDLTNYAAITGWIYITTWPLVGVKEVLLYGWDTGAVDQVGNSVELADYVSIVTFNVWQRFVIPLEDLGLTGATIDSIRIQTIGSGGGSIPNYYLDDMQIEQTGAIQAFKVEPDLGTWLHVKQMGFQIADAYGGTLADATMPNLSYNQILGEAALENGVLYTRKQKGEVRAAIPFRQLSNLLGFPGAYISNLVSDGTNTFMTITVDFSAPIALRAETKDNLTLTLSDDMTGFLQFQANITGWVEEREIYTKRLTG